MPEQRIDELTGALVVIASGRQQRPHRPASACPFCVGGLEAPEPYDVKAFVNRWPTFPDGRTAALGARDDVAYVLVFENRGEEVGATVPHPHGQIYAYDEVPSAPLAELRHAARGDCPLCASHDRALDVAASADWRAWVPAASAYPYGMLLAPDVHRPDLPALDGPQRDGLADLLIDALARLDRLFDTPLPYMLWIHQRPTDGGLWPEAHLHLHIVSPMRSPGVQRYVAGGELGSGLLVNPVVPEDAAAALRGA